MEERGAGDAAKRGRRVTELVEMYNQMGEEDKSSIGALPAKESGRVSQEALSMEEKCRLLERSLNANHFLNVKFMKQNHALFSEYKKGTINVRGVDADAAKPKSEDY